MTFPKLTNRNIDSNERINLLPKTNSFAAIIGILIFFVGAIIVSISLLEASLKAAGTLGILIMAPFLVLDTMLLYFTSRYLLSKILVGKTFLIVSQEPFEPGSTVGIQIFHQGDYETNSVSIELIGSEIRDTGGEGGRDIHCFYKNEIFRQGAKRASKNQSLAHFHTQIPTDTQYSMEQNDYAIEWEIVVTINLLWRPNVKSFFPVRLGTSAFVSKEQSK